MGFTIDLSHAALICYGTLLGLMGNILYRVQNKLPIKPLKMRIAWGVFALAMYLLVCEHLLKYKELNLLTMLGVIIAGFLIEDVSKMLPGIVDKYKNNKLGGDKDEKR